MSRLIKTTADEMLSETTNTNVMGQYDDLDAELPGKVVLASANMMPNPDLVDVDERGRLECWDLDAPPGPDSWNIYIKQTHRYNNAGTLERIGGADGDSRPMLRQNQSLQRWTEHTYQQDDPLLTDKALPDLGKDEETDLAPVLDAPRVKAVTRTGGGGGYPAKSAGALVCSYFGILGDNPHQSKRVTPSADAVPMPAITAGQHILFIMPDEIPDSWTGVGFCVGPSSGNMRIQKRVDVRGRVVTEVLDRGPYRTDGMIVGPTSPNRTYMGDFESSTLDKPKVWHDRSHFILKSENYQFAYQLKTKQGWTAASKINSEQVVNDQHGESLRWIPHKSALQQPGIERWRPLFKARDDNWYTFKNAYANGYPLRKSAVVHGTQVNEKWKHAADPKKIGKGRPEKDHSGVPGPKEVMEPPTAQDATRLTPGKYAVRVTTANSKLDMESRPSPRTSVLLQETSPGSKTTNEFIRVFRPAGQSIKNSRLVETDSADGNSTELHWERPTTTGITVGDGVFSVASASGAGTLLYRRSSIEPVNPNLYYALRMRLQMTRYVSGIVRARIRFLSAESNAALIGTERVFEDFTGLGDRHVKTTFGPADSAAHHEMPSNTTHVQFEIIGLDNGTARNFDFSMSNVGLWAGRAHPRKVYDLTLAEDTPHKDSWPVPDGETPVYHYPSGPYIRTITSPTNPAKHRSFTQLELMGFEKWNNTPQDKEGWADVTASTATFNVGDVVALAGNQGSRIDVPNGAAIGYGAFVWKNFLSVGRTTFGVEAYYRVKSLPTAGNVGILGVTRDATNTNFLGYAEITSAGAIRLQAWNGATFTQANVVGVTLQPGDDIRVDLSFSGVKTAGSNGAVTLRVKRNDLPAITATVNAQPWSTLDANRVVAGYFGGTAAQTAASRMLMDRIRVASNSISETTDVPGSMVEYWAPEGQPAGDPDHFMTNVRFPVLPATTYVDSCYLAHDGITTPAAGADLFRITSFDKDGNELTGHGYLAQNLKGKHHWDRYYLTYTTPADAAYVQYTRNHVGDGLIWAMGFQHELGVVPAQFINTNATSGDFSVILDTTITGGPKDADISFNKSLLRARIVATQAYNETTGAALTTTKWQMKAADTLAKLATASYGADNTVTATPAHRYIQMKVFLTTIDNTVSPEVRAVFVDMERDRPVLTRADGRDFHGGAIVYNVTPASPVPNVVRKEMADGSISVENIGRGRTPEKLKLSVQAFTELGKRLIERNAATENPEFSVEMNGSRYLVLMLPEFTGNVESEPDGTEYWDYVADGIEADVVGTEDL